MPGKGINSWQEGFVRYWAVSISLVHAYGYEWPGFGYTDEEKADLETIAETVEGEEFLLFLVINSIIGILGIILLVLAGLLPAMKVLDPNFKSPAVFYIVFGATVIVEFSLVLPISMALSSTIIRTFYSRGKRHEFAPELIRPLFKKIIWQFLRMGVVAAFIVTSLALLLPEGSNYGLVREILGFLQPIVALLTLFFLFGGRLGDRKKDK